MSMSEIATTSADRRCGRVVSESKSSNLVSLLIFEQTLLFFDKETNKVLKEWERDFSIARMR